MSKPVYLETNWVEITPQIEEYYRLQSKRAGHKIIPLPVGESAPGSKRAPDNNADPKSGWKGWGDYKPEDPAEYDGELVNINTASKGQLAALDGIGLDGAERVVKHRPFETVEDLTDVGGIGEKTLDKLREFITV